MGKGQGRRAEQERKDMPVLMCDPEQQHKVVLSSQLFATEGNDVTILFGLKNENYCGACKHEKLICMPCHLERYLPFHPGCCHIFRTMAQFLLENLLMDHLFLSLSHHGLHSALLLERHYPDLSGNGSSCLKAAQKVPLEIQLFQLKHGLFIAVTNTKAQKQIK